MKEKKEKRISGLIARGLTAEEVAEAANWREINFPLCPNWKSSWDRYGVERLVDSAKEYYEEATGQGLPWNLSIHGPWVGCPVDKKLWEGDKYDSPPAEEMIETAARMASWLKIIVDDKLVGLQKIFAKNLSPRGMFASRTKINPYKFLDVWNSPHTAEKIFWKAYRRARQILKPFGIAPSWEAVGRIMTATNVSHRVGKMAFAIAAETVNCFLYNRTYQQFTGTSIQILAKARGIGECISYKRKDRECAILDWAISRIEAGEFVCIREAFIHKNRLILDGTDDVFMYIDPTLTILIHGVECIPGWNVKTLTFQYLLRQVSTGRTYHAFGESPRKAVKSAIGAWHRRVKLERETSNLEKFLEGDNGFCPLVFKEDSYRAGNCKPGTESWLRRQGWEERKFIPGQWLISHLSNPLVRNVAMVLYKDMAS